MPMSSTSSWRTEPAGNDDGEFDFMTMGIRITDLAAPQLNDAARSLMGSVTEDMVVLDAEGILAVAREQTGLDDFGDMEFVERLRLCCQAYRDDTDLNTMGRLTCATVLIRSAVQRLRHEQLWRQHPEIAEVEISRPIIIAGLPRTGTTHLLNLISADSRLRSLQYWESLEPFPAPGEPVSGDDDDPRIQRCIDEFAFRDQIMPYFKNMHEMTPRHIHEEAELQMLDFSTQFVETMALVPEWRDYYLAHDQTPHYRYMKRTQQALQWLRGPERWIMKSPQHVEHLPAVHRVFPDATYVVTHRDPVSVVTSLCTMICYAGRIGREPVRPREIATYWIDRTETMLNACVRDVEQLPAEQVVHVHFKDFMADDMGTIARIYERAGHPLTEDVAAAMRSYIAANPRGKHGQILYDVEADFGYNPDELYQRFRNYTDYFNVSLERNRGR
jgi:hypothetical protein